MPRIGLILGRSTVKEANEANVDCSLGLSFLLFATILGNRQLRHSRPAGSGWWSPLRRQSGRSFESEKLKARAASDGVTNNKTEQHTYNNRTWVKMITMNINVGDVFRFNGSYHSRFRRGELLTVTSYKDGQCIILTNKFGISGTVCPCESCICLLSKVSNLELLSTVSLWLHGTSLYGSCCSWPRPWPT